MTADTYANGHGTAIGLVIGGRWSVALARLAFASVSMLTAIADRSFDFAQDDG